MESNVGQVKNKNSVYAYSNDGTGVLTAITGSPYLTHGSGVFEFNSVFSPGFRADQEIVINSAGTLLFAVNGNSASFAIKLRWQPVLPGYSGIERAGSGQHRPR